ncbi:MAG: tRNA (adenosine(37)-N6)-dimethylallyltransferase MiaA [Pseudomonadota bacterium]|nr:tRNA (adenosine(37)-N6)-dimethylallyltransferase MiaA [Pseudomonadota bacterium]
MIKTQTHKGARRPLIVLFGPTASGKTSLGVDLANHVGGEVVNIDSRQLYKEMPIITAMPTAEEQAGAPHHLYEVLEVSEKCDALKYAEMAKKTCEEIWGRGKVPILLGGTGFYIQSLLEGLSPIPEIDEGLIEQLNERETEALYTELSEKDAAAAKQIDALDRQKIVRALSVFLVTGQSIVEWQKLPRVGALECAPYYIALNPERQRLIDRINLRFDIMVDDGVEAEMRALYDKKYPLNLPAMTSIGAPDFYDYFDGKLPWNELVEKVSQQMRRYAKRQRTWLRGKYPHDLMVENPQTEKQTVLDGADTFLKELSAKS